MDNLTCSDEWRGCYDEGWRGLIVPEAFSHPAKFAYGLLTRILAHGLGRGYWQTGDTILDPFCGVATGGIVCAYRGLKWIGVECEQHFVALAERNLGLHRSKLEGLRCPIPKVVLGDSRYLCHHLAAAGNGCGGTFSGPRAQGSITSPPYADIATGAGGLNSKPAKKEGQQSGRSPQSASQSADQHYGRGAITSPPYVSGGHHTDVFDAWNVNSRGQLIKKENAGYGKNSQQIGRLKSGDYRTAMFEVYGQLFFALEAGSVIAVVVKDYVKDNKRVPLCQKTWELLELCGFDGLERKRAMLVEEYVHEDLFEGAVTKEKNQKSFFRRLHESRGGPAIDYEEVLFLIKPEQHQH